MITFWKTLSAIVAAALIAGAVTGFPAIEYAKATDTSQVIRVAAPAPIIRNDQRAPPIIDIADRGWPYRNAANMRLIALDKVK